MNQKTLALALTASILVASSAGCGTVNVDDTDAVLTIGQTISPKSLDPASTYSSSDFEIMYQIYPTVLNTLPSETTLKGDVAAEFGFLAPTEFRVKVKQGLRFSNGNELTASDVAFSFNRLLEMDEAGGPQALLMGTVGARAIDEFTVVYDLITPYDQSFPYILSSVPGIVVDEEEFPLKRPLSIEEIINSKSFAGPYELSVFEPGELLALTPNETYQGLWGKAKNSGVIVKYFDDPKNMLLSLENGELDIATLFRSVSADQANSVAGRGGFSIVSSQGVEPGFLSFNLATQPYGSGTASADPGKALAVRHAVAALLDRSELSELAYLGTYKPAFSTVPSSIPGHHPSFLEKHPLTDARAVESILQSQGISTPISLELIFTPERYGENAAKLPFLIENQLEKGGVFDIELRPLDWSTLREVRKTDDYQIVLLFWGPDFGEADNYLTPLYSPDGWLFNHFENARMDQLLSRQLSEESVEERLLLLKEIQNIAADEAPLIPLLEGGRSALVRNGVTGVAETFDSSFKFRYSFIEKNK